MEGFLAGAVAWRDIRDVELGDHGSYFLPAHGKEMKSEDLLSDG